MEQGRLRRVEIRERKKKLCPPRGRNQTMVLVFAFSFLFLTRVWFSWNLRKKNWEHGGQEGSGQEGIRKNLFSATSGHFLLEHLKNSVWNPSLWGFTSSLLFAMFPVLSSLMRDGFSFQFQFWGQKKGLGDFAISRETCQTRRRRTNFWKGLRCHPYCCALAGTCSSAGFWHFLARLCEFLPKYVVPKCSTFQGKRGICNSQWRIRRTKSVSGLG